MVVINTSAHPFFALPSNQTVQPQGFLIVCNQLKRVKSNHGQHPDPSGSRMVLAKYRRQRRGSCETWLSDRSTAHGGLLSTLPTPGEGRRAGWTCAARPRGLDVKGSFLAWLGPSASRFGGCGRAFGLDCAQPWGNRRSVGAAFPIRTVRPRSHPKTTTWPLGENEDARSSCICGLRICDFASSPQQDVAFRSGRIRVVGFAWPSCAVARESAAC